MPTRTPGGSGPTARPPAGVLLGPFALHDPIARGGVGSVWRGVHVGQDVPVAVKVLDRPLLDEGLEEAFAREVRAVARLDHPGVVWVFDVGRVSAAAAAASEGRLADGAPFIAMEFASRGTLRDLGAQPWGEVKRILLALLEALAHAHARDVIHRDLKPANVLVCSDDDLRPGLKLADFGIAHAHAETREQYRVALGTLAYMAPEQIRHEPWAVGPWTDLYALGNVAWELLTGRVPFAGREGSALARAQLDEVLPVRGLPAPEALCHWIARCTAKDPDARFDSAAAAAAVLAEIPDGDHFAPPPIDEASLDDLPTVAMQRFDDGPHTAEIPPLASRAAPPAAPAPQPRPAPSFGGWRGYEGSRRSLVLLGAGLTLWNLRRPPMVGRVAERDRLWGALGRVVATGRPRLVLLRGAAGVGRSRLGQWVAERAAELGYADALQARFFDGDDDGPIRRLWTRHFRLEEVEPGSRARWLARRLAALEVPGAPGEYAALISPGPAEERHRRSIEVLRALVRRRPMVMLLDDVHLGLDGVALIERLLQERGAFPMLIVGTVRAEDLADRPGSRARLDALAGRAEVIEVGPLALRDHVMWIEEMLGLSPALAAQVVERTGGNPQFTLRLVGEWIRRGVLALGPSGFQVRAGERADIPPDLRSEWDPRIDRILRHLPPMCADLLLRAAVLGMEVDRGEWALACDDPDGSQVRAGQPEVVAEHEALREELVRRLFEGRLAFERAGGFSFAHGMVREALLARADADVLAEHHVAVAELLRRRSPDQVERIGHHALSGGDLERAMGPLFRGIARRRDVAGPRSALGWLARAEEALRAGGVPRSHAWWAELWATRAGLCAELGALAEAEASADRLILGAEGRPDWTAHAVDARIALGRLHAARGDRRRADEVWAQVVLDAQDPVQRGLATAERALLAARAGDVAGARTLADGAVRWLRRAANARALAECWRVVARTASLGGDDESARAAWERAGRLFEQREDLVGQADCLAGLGAIAVRAERWAEAEDHLLGAIARYEVAGSDEVVAARSDLARVWWATGRRDAARELAAELRRMRERHRPARRADR